MTMRAGGIRSLAGAAGLAGLLALGGCGKEPTGKYNVVLISIGMAKPMFICTAK